MGRTKPGPGYFPGRSILSGLLMLAIPTGEGILFPASARATLGEVEASVARDRTVSSGTHTITQAAGGVRIHTISSPERSYREYVAPNGTVFAVTWQGMHPPRLKAILGTYAAEYRQALVRARSQTASPSLRSRFLRLTTPNLLIDGGGQPRALGGRVILPAKIPPGFPLDQIR